MAPVAFATAFGIALLQALIGLEQQLTDANALVSPLSGSAALTLALNAAGLPSPTQAELLRALTQNRTVLGDGSAQEAAVNAELARLMAAVPSAGGDLETSEQVLLANALFTKEGIAVKKSYIDAMVKKFKAKVAMAKGPADVNAWVKGVTQGLIPELLSPDTEFDMVLTNALYFKGKWRSQFKESDTSPRPFTTAKGAKKQVSMMSQDFRPGQVLTAQVPGSFKAVRMPYRSGGFSAIAILPDNATVRPASLLPLFRGPKGPAASLFAPLPGGSGGALKAGAAKGIWQPVGSKGLQVQLPRFKIRAHMSLKHPLQKKMGVVAGFSDAKANFERAEGDPNQPFFMSDVVQEVVLNVDEEGTEAAAATAVLIMVTSAPLVVEPPPQLVFDRPFIFALVHDATGVPLVLGVIRDPPPAQPRPAAPKPPAGAAAEGLGGFVPGASSSADMGGTSVSYDPSAAAPMVFTPPARPLHPGAAPAAGMSSPGFQGTGVPAAAAAGGRRLRA